MAESANVNVVIQAFTDAAEQALENVGDELNNLSGDALPADQAINQVAEELDDATASALLAGEALEGAGDDTVMLAAAMQALSSRADQAGDDLRESGYSAGFMSGMFSNASVSAGNLSFSLTALSGAIMLSLVPALVTLSTMLFPLVGALGAVAAGVGALGGAFATVIGTGVVTYFEEIQNALQEIRQPVLDAIEPLGRMFGPDIVQAIRAIPGLIREIVAEMDNIGVFAAHLAAVGSAAADALPGVIAGMMDLATRALPMFRDAMSWLGDRGPGIMRAMVDVTEAIAPAVISFAESFAAAVPALTKIGVIVTNMVLPALGGLFDVLRDASQFILSLEDSLRNLSVAGLLTAPIILGVATAIGSLTGPLGVAAAAAAAFAAAYRSNFMGVQEATNAALAGARDALAAFGSTLQDVASSIGLGALLDDLADTFTSLGAQAVPVVDTLVSTFQDARPQFQRMASMLTDGLRSVVTMLRTVVLPAFRFVVGTFLIPLVNRLATAWSDNFAVILSETMDAIDSIVGYVQPALDLLAGAWNAWGDEITAVLTFLADALTGILGTALNAFAKVVLSVLHALQGDWSEAIAVLVEIFVDAFNGLLDFIRDWRIIESLKAAVNGIISAIQATVLQTIPGLFIMAFAKILSFIGNWRTSLMNLLISAFNAVVNIVAGAVEGLVNMVVNAINDVLRTIDDVADKVSEIPGIDNVDVGRLENVNIDTQGLTQDRVQSNRQQDARQYAQAMAATLELDVTGDGPLAEWLDQEASVNTERMRAAEDRYQQRMNQGNDATGGG